MPVPYLNISRNLTFKREREREYLMSKNENGVMIDQLTNEILKNRITRNGDTLKKGFNEKIKDLNTRNETGDYVIDLNEYRMTNSEALELLNIAKTTTRPSKHNTNSYGQIYSQTTNPLVYLRTSYTKEGFPETESSVGCIILLGKQSPYLDKWEKIFQGIEE